MNSDCFPKTSLGFFPTPLIALPRLSEVLGGPDISMKRDDQTGLALGGNKTRKLEYILGDALNQGCNTIITAGAAQSNHCRQTAAAAAKLGLECHLVLGGELPALANGNLLLDRIFGAEIHWAGMNRKGEDLPELYSQLEARGKIPYHVPYGGSNELGALAFTKAFQELEEQCLGQPMSHIVFASSSGGTQAGLMLGKFLQGSDCKIVGVCIDKDGGGSQPFDQHILSLADRTAAMLGESERFSNDDVHLNTDYLGAGYGVVGEAEREAIEIMARTEGILLDPVYTGRAMAGLIGMIRTGEIRRDAHVLFWHTGGTPAIFAQADIFSQPICGDFAP